MKLMVFYLLGVHSTDWRYVGLADAGRIFGFSVLSSALIFVFSFFQESTRIPRGVMAIDCLLTFVLTAAIRLSARVFRERLRSLIREELPANESKAIIIGAGDAGEMLLREIKRNPKSGFRVLTFFDDDALKRGRSIHGVRVRGTTEEIGSYVARYPVDTALVAIPSANRSQMRRINSMLKALNIPVKTLPPLYEIVEKTPALTQLRDISITDLLGREEISIDTKQVHDLIHGRVVLVTGAGGSIGSELCRQVLARGPRKLLLLERSENNLFHIHRKLVASPLGDERPIVPLLCDVTHREDVHAVLQAHRPELVFHSAAHKHVAMQEYNPEECFKNNVGGTSVLVQACHEVGVERFLFISTDKAVNPSSVTGATKRACELYCQAFGDKSPTQFMSVRFGNVLASEGSVVQLFLEQIAEGGPVTVTHPEVRRYFMTIPEAVTLVLQATALGESGQIMVLDMGEPIKIVDLAHQLMYLAGKDDDDIPLQFTGLKPGEKLFEELRFDTEVWLKTAHEKIRILNQQVENPLEVIAEIERGVEAAFRNPESFDARLLLHRIVPEYQEFELTEDPPAVEHRKTTIPNAVSNVHPDKNG
jgi:FlaA1/EpsC-like NDP-sugar epimerase